MEPASQASETQREARDRAILRTCTALPAALLVVTAVYATTRYVVFGPWPVAHVPLYVLNKAFAWTSIVLLALALGLGPAARLWPTLGAHLWRRRWWGLVGFALATVHILVSLAILNYGYYRLMFRQAFEFTPLAEFAMAGRGTRLVRHCWRRSRPPCPACRRPCRCATGRCCKAGACWRWCWRGLHLDLRRAGLVCTGAVARRPAPDHAVVGERGADRARPAAADDPQTRPETAMSDPPGACPSVRWC